MPYAVVRDGVITIVPTQDFIPTDSVWIEIPSTINDPIWIKINDDGTLSIRDESEVLSIYKNNKLTVLYEYTTSYIKTYYPLEKQASDQVDTQYWQNYLLMYGIDPVVSRQTIAYCVLQFYDGGWSFEVALNVFLPRHPNPGNVTYWEFAVEQLLKSSIRLEWVKRVKDQFRQLLSILDNTTSLNDIKSLTFEINVPFPYLPTIYSL